MGTPGIARLGRLGAIVAAAGLAAVLLGAPTSASASAVWTPQSSGITNNLFGGDCASRTTCWAVGGSGEILATTNGGTTWTAQSSGVSVGLKNAACPDATHCMAVGNGGTTIVTTNGGASWTDVSSVDGTTNNLTAITCVGTSLCIAVGASGTIIATTDFGSSWSTMTSAFSNNLNNVACVDAGHCWAVGGSGKIEYGNGSTWTAQTSSTSSAFQGIACTGASSCWAVGAGGLIDRWNGSVWSLQASGVSSTLYSISCPAASTCWAVGVSGTIIETSDGSTWSADASNAGSAQLNKVVFGDTRDGFAFGNDGVIDAYTNPDTTPPNAFSLSAPSAASDVTNGVTLSSSPTDDSSISTVAYGYCPGSTCTWASATPIGTASTGPPFSVTWSSQPANGTYSLIARATDPYGNSTDSSTTTVYVNNATSAAGASVSSLSWPHTVVAGSSSVLVVAVTAEHTSSSCQASGVTYGGTALTQIASSGVSGAYYECTSLWYLLAPPAGTATVSVTFGAALNGASAGAETLYGIKQAAPDAYSTGSNSTGAATTSVTTVAPDSTVVDAFASGQKLGDLAPGAGQTAFWSLDDESPGDASGGSSWKPVANAGPTSMTWTQTGINRSAQVVAVFAPPDTTPPNTFSLSSPSPGATVANGQTLSSSPTDPNSSVASVAYGYCPGSSCTFAASTLIGTATSGSPFSVTWSNQPANGTYTLIARATDPSGNSTDSSPTTVTVSNAAVTPWYNASWGYRKAITVDHTKVAGNLTGFPLLIDLPSDASLAAHAQASGNDILFTSSDGVTKLKHQIESYNPSTGALVAWVQVPSLSATTDTTIYMYFGNSSAGDQESATGTWDSGYAGVFHLGSGSSLSLADSTSRANTGTNSGATAAAGQIYGGAAFNGSGQSFSTGAAGMPAINGALTMSAWFYVPSSAGYGTRDIATLYSNSTADQLRITSGGTLQVSEWGGAIAVTGTKTISLGAWHYGVFTYNGSTASVYLDGSLDTSANASVQSGSATALRVGTYGSGEYWNGSLDEVRVSSTVRSASWIKTEYDNQSSAATFYSLGSLQTYTAPCSGGTLSLSLPAVVGFPPVTLNGADQTSSTTVTLTPDDETGSGAGWSITGTSTTFATAAGKKLPGGASITSASRSAAAGNCSLPANGITYPLGLPAGSTPPAAVKLYNAAAGTGKGPTNVALVLQLAVPANAYGGTYTSTWTIATVSGP